MRKLKMVKLNMMKELRAQQIRNELTGKSCPMKRNLAKSIGLSLGTLNRYLAEMRKKKEISYMRSTHKDKYGRTYVILN